MLQRKKGDTVYEDLLADQVVRHLSQDRGWRGGGGGGIDPLIPCSSHTCASDLVLE